MTNPNQPHKIGAIQPPRILPLQPDELGVDDLALAARLRGAFNLPTDEIPGVVATMLRHPALYRAQVEYYARRSEALVGDARIRELAILRISWLCQSPFLWGEHVKMGKSAGLTAEDIERITQGPARPGWTSRESAVLSAVDELKHNSIISDGVWEILAREFSDRELIELMILVGDHQEVAQIYNSLRVELMPGNPGLSAR